MNYGGGYEAYGNEEYGGGGFMDTSNSQYGSQVGTPSKGGSRPRGNRETQTLIPVTIRQLQNVIKSESDDVFRIDNHEVSSVKIIGLLSNVNAHSTNVNFQVNDGTGTIEGRLFLHSEDGEYSENEASRLQDGMYVRVVGSLRSFQDKVNLSCFSVTPITDFNELTHHFLDAIYVHCYNTKGPLSSSGNDMKMDFTNSSSNLFGGLATGQNQNNHNSMDYSMMDSNFSPEQQAILDVLGTCMSDRGLKIDQIYDGLRGQMSMDQLRNVLTYLTSEGHVYSTVDENHFKRTA